ncbi:MAG TPA: MoaD/ThiS family protein [Chitinophagaceae bacterium]|nr:MoaD/ThiS family protein [Chitinophagaceae bacterium]
MSQTLRIFVFGPLTDIIQDTQLHVPFVNSSEALRILLDEMYPQLKHYSFQIAINKQLAHGHMPITPNCEIALLPPYSGG